MENGPELHSLIPLEEFKTIFGIDSREDVLSRYCLITATYTIEQYCKRQLLLRKNTDYLSFTGEYIFPLREYPVRKILAVWAAGAVMGGEPFPGPESLVDPKQYYCLPEPSTGGEGGGSPPDEDIREDSDLWPAPFLLILRPPIRLSREGLNIKVRYEAGYEPGKAGDPGGVPADLASACLELAAWNMARYRGRRIGMTGNVRGSGRDGEHLEASMPENARQLLEPYRRRML